LITFYVDGVDANAGQYRWAAQTCETSQSWWNRNALAGLGRRSGTAMRNRLKNQLGSFL